MSKRSRPLDQSAGRLDIPVMEVRRPYDHELTQRLTRGARCVLCGEPVRAGEDALVTPDFVADEQDAMFRFTDAVLHRACFYMWDGRKAFVARFNRLAQGLAAPDGTRPFLTAEGRLVRKRTRPRRGHGPPTRH